MAKKAVRKIPSPFLDWSRNRSQERIPRKEDPQKENFRDIQKTQHP